MIAMYLFDQCFDQFFCHLKISDNPIAQGPNCLNIPWCLAQHMLRILAHSQDFAFPAHISNCHNARFVQHDPLSANVNQRIRSPQVDGHITGKQS